MSDCDDFFGAQHGLDSAKGASAILDALHDSIEVLEVFPDKTADAQIVRYTFFGAIWKEILLHGTSDWNIINIWDSSVGDFGLEYAGDVVMKYQN